MNFWRKIFKREDLKPPEDEGRVEASLAENVENKDVKKTGRMIYGSILRSARITEKTAALGKERNTYVFSVTPESNKTAVRRAVEERYGVKVETVGIVNLPAKMRRRGRIIGWKPGFKKAMVKVKEGESIDVQ